MHVIKRSGKKELVNLEKIVQRVKTLSTKLKVDPIKVAQKVIASVCDGITTKQLDELLAETSSVLASEHYDYAKLAGKIAVSALHKETTDFFQTVKLLYKAGVVSEELVKFTKEHGRAIEKAIDYDRDFDFDYFGFKTLEKSYLLKINKKVTERPQHMFMRVAIGLASESLEEVIKLYDLMSQGFYTHATPTLYNAATKSPQLSSCFLLEIGDSIEEIFDGLKECALISKMGGGIGAHIHDIRGFGSHIKTTNGYSSGIVPMLRVFNEGARYVDQSGKRKGAWAVYIEPWHSDVEAFLDLRKNTGKEEFRTKDLFTAMWMSNLFLKRVENDEDWTLFSPDEARGLSSVYGDEFEKLYTKYEADGIGRKVIKARELQEKIIESLIETGTPYILNKDEINEKSNQKNLGIIKNSNLCTEIVEYTDKDNIASCNLASICLPKFVKQNKDGVKFDFDLLAEVTRTAISNLNKVIDKTYYPLEKAKVSNLKHRPLGLGIQGLSDVFFMFAVPFASKEAKQLNIDMAETMYFAALESSMELAKKHGPYESFKGSPASEGILQFDMWGVKPSNRYDWDKLKEDIKTNGLRNSLLIALMPTASTSQIFGNNECFEPITSNIYKRSVLAGEFIVVNKHLINELEKLGLWSVAIRDKIISENGSVQNIKEIPDNIKDIYRTVWEISQKDIIDMAADRGPYVCQSQSMNLFIAKPNFGNINTMIFYAWSKKLKTMNYYLRTKPTVDAVKVNVPSKEIACSLENPEACEACGS